MRRGVTFVEMMVAVGAAAGLLFAVVAVMTNSSLSTRSGQASLSNVYESGRILSQLRQDLDGALRLEPPFAGPDGEGLELLSFPMLAAEEEGGTLQPVNWRFDENSRTVLRERAGTRQEFGRGRIRAFRCRVLPFPAAADLKGAEKVCVKVELQMADGNEGPEGGRAMRLTHVITPMELNRFLRSHSTFVE